MKRSKRTLSFVSVSVLIIFLASFVNASTAPIRNLNYSFTPIDIPKEAGPIKLEISFIPKYGGDKFTAPLLKCDEVQIEITELINIIYSGDTSWIVQIDSGKWTKTILEVDIPPNDTSGIQIVIQCGRTRNPSACYFVTTGDTVEFYRGNPRGYHPSEPHAQVQPFVVDTLSEEQLQTKYEVVLELTDKAKHKYVESLVGKIPDSAIYDEKRSYYRLWISLENLIKIGENKIDCGFVTPPPWAPESRAKQQTKKKNGEESDSSGEQIESQIPIQETRLIPKQISSDESQLQPQAGNPQLAVGALNS